MATFVAIPFRQSRFGNGALVLTPAWLIDAQRFLSIGIRRVAARNWTLSDGQIA